MQISTKSSSILGYNPKVKFEIGIENFFNWLKEYEKFQKLDQNTDSYSVVKLETLSSGGETGRKTQGT